jgi:hypothetical protein
MLRLRIRAQAAGAGIIEPTLYRKQGSEIDLHSWLVRIQACGIYRGGGKGALCASGIYVPIGDCSPSLQEGGGGGGAFYCMRWYGSS